MRNDACPFCSPPADRLIHDDELVAAMWDGFPVSRGHALIVPKRHVARWREATVDERDAMFRTVDLVRSTIEKDFAPNGYNIGINDGAAAGQTVPHLHLHVIPRYEGDVEDPRGGIRHVIPAKADYWSR